MEITLDNSQLRQAISEYLLKQGYELETGMMYGNPYEEAFAICQIRPLGGEPVKNTSHASTAEDKHTITNVTGKL